MSESQKILLSKESVLHTVKDFISLDYEKGTSNDEGTLESYDYAKRHLFSLIKRMQKILEQKDCEIVNELQKLKTKILDACRLRSHLQKAQNLDYKALVALANRDMHTEGKQYAKRGKKRKPKG